MAVARKARGHPFEAVDVLVAECLEVTYGHAEGDEPLAVEDRRRLADIMRKSSLCVTLAVEMALHPGRPEPLATRPALGKWRRTVVDLLTSDAEAQDDIRRIMANYKR